MSFLLSQPQIAEALEEGVYVANIPYIETTEQYQRRLIRQYDWDPTIAEAIMRCESSGRADALNDTPSTRDYSVGLFQINLFGDLAKSRPSEAWLKEPENNIAYAYELYKGGGFKRHWTNCYKKLSL